ncbi:MAG: hypothetical protein SFX73_24520 [Kofleriaceae bacterium]|nr:hypothetical protein [Kofleriaceae bacterium]
MKPLLTLLATTLCATALAHAQPGAPSSSAPHSLVVHVPPLTTPAGEPLELEAMLDAPFAEALVVSWRPLGVAAGAAWTDVAFERSSAGGWFATVPTASPPGLEYYIHGKDTKGLEVTHFASADHPHVVRVDPTEVDRLEELDLERLGGRRNAFSVDVTGHNFGNRYDIQDQFLRAEATYAHYLLRHIHHIAFGFGSIEGRTPFYDGDPATEDTFRRTALRYGFGELGLRLHRSVFFDARVLLGVSHEGFDGGARAVMTFGKPWRSNLSIGGEVIGDLGPTGWVRLQWDTAAPLLMGASVVRTNLPGVSIDPNGLYIAYDLAYRVQARCLVKAQLSYGARDGSAHVGGGLGTSLEF